MKANLIQTTTPPPLLQQPIRPINNRINRLTVAIVVVFLLLMGAYIMGGISLANNEKMEHYLKKNGKHMKEMREAIQELTDASDGNSGGSGSGNNGVNGFNSLIKQTPEPSGDNCMYGGIKLDTGLDLNRDGILQQNEIMDTGYVCNGIPGVNGNPGINALVIVTNEPIGSIHCPNGGIKIESGLDLNGDGNLNGEPTTISYVCNGLNGNGGSSGGGTIGQTTTTTTTTKTSTNIVTPHLLFVQDQNNVPFFNVV